MIEETPGMKFVRHVVGNNLPHFRGYHEGSEPRRSAETIREIQGRTCSFLENGLKRDDIIEEGALAVLATLTDTDLTQLAAYEAMNRAYQAYVGAYDEELRQLRDELLS